MDVLRYAAFTDDPAGGNPAGVVIADALPDADRMLEIAADVGYSETAFLMPTGERSYRIRYFAPAAEVDFCGHATIASGVVLGDRHGAGRYELQTNPGPVTVDVDEDEGAWTAALTSVTPEHRTVGDDELAEALAALGWQHTDLDPDIAPAVAFAGAWHLVLAVREHATLQALAYDYERLGALMAAGSMTTAQLIWRASPTTFHARDPFPPGGVVEDPATGAAAAALGGYLRDAGLVRTPASLVLHQGTEMGRPSRIEVDVPPQGGIVVRGRAVPIPVSG